MPAVGRGRPVLTTYLTRVPIGASLTLGRAATAATQLRIQPVVRISETTYALQRGGWHLGGLQPFPVVWCASSG